VVPRQTRSRPGGYSSRQVVQRQTSRHATASSCAAAGGAAGVDAAAACGGTSAGCTGGGVGAGSGLARGLVRRTAVLFLRDLGGMLMYRSLLEKQKTQARSSSVRRISLSQCADEREREPRISKIRLYGRKPVEAVSAGPCRVAGQHEEAAGQTCTESATLPLRLFHNPNCGLPLYAFSPRPHRAAGQHLRQR